jgi:hypothetical protein
MASKGYNKHIAYVAMSRHIGAMWKKWHKRTVRSGDAPELGLFLHFYV